MVPRRWPTLLTVTTRAAGAASSRSRISPVNANGPRWLMPSVCSNPSAVRPARGFTPPALLISRSRCGYSARSQAAAVRTESSAARSSSTVRSWAPGTASRIRPAAAAALTGLRQARTTAAPCRASSRAVWKPRPVLAPVTTAVRPRRSGRSASVHRWLMDALRKINGTLIPFNIRDGRPVCQAAVGGWQDEGMSEAETEPVTEPKQRSDARRNRARILAVAVQAFATEGLSVPVQEIARRAGVGTGTVSRHFPTKESLFEAILLSRARQLTEEATQLLEEADPGAAFFGFFTRLIAEGAANLGLAEALTGAGYDLDEAVGRDGVDPMRALARLLIRAQAAGAVRPDVDAADVKALIGGCLARAAGAPGPAALDRMVSIARQGLESRP